MRALIYHVATTLDGFLAREDGSFDFFPTQGDHVDDYLASLASYGDAVMGKATYQVGLQFGVTDPYPMLRTHVLSRTLGPINDPKIHVVRDDAVGFVRELKQGDGKPIYLCGGAALASSLFAAQLIDEVRVKLNPVMLGHGLALAPGLGAPLPLHLIDTRTYTSGVVLLRYRTQA